LAGWCDFSGKGVSIGLRGSTIVSSDNRVFNSDAAAYTTTNGTEDKPRQRRDVIVLTHKADSGYITVYQSAP
jgi:hypothetical protein